MYEERLCKSVGIGGRMVFAEYDIYYLILNVLKLIFFVLTLSKVALKNSECLVLVFSNMHYSYNVYECSL